MNPIESLFGLAGRVVMITGAGQGIGSVYARRFAEAGAIPIVVDLNRDKAERVASEIAAAGGRAQAAGGDVTQFDSLKAIVDEAIGTHGRLDVLINNAAIFSTIKMRPFEEIPLDEWDRMMNVNVTGCFNTVRAVAPSMKAARWGRIVNISSVVVPLGMTGYLHYVASKSALHGMTNALARELGDWEITVNTVLPGGVATEVPRSTRTEAEKTAMLARQCIKRPAVPDDLIGTIMYLSSPASAYVTGQSITVDGGLSHG